MSSAPESTTLDAKIRVEFSINASKQGELDKIDEALRSRGVDLVKSSLEDKTIQLELGHGPGGELPNIETLQQFIEKETGLLTVLKGLGTLSSAVAELQGKPENLTSNGRRNNIMGVMRMSQLSNGYCYFDGLLDGFSDDDTARRYSVSVHEFGDLSGPMHENIGESIIKIDNCDTAKNGKVSIQTMSKCNVQSMIGRSVAVTEHHNQSVSGAKIVAAGVVARASIIEGNTKQICSCSGKTLWDERVDKKQKEVD